MQSIVILASGSGTNADNIARVFGEGSRVKVEALLTDRENAPVRAKMEALGIPVVYFPRKEWRESPAVIADFVKSNYHPDLVVLAGFNSILKEEFVDSFEGRILNIHPSLLPKFGGPGMWGHNVHEAVLAAGEKESGVTVHIVTNEVDGGPIVLQETVPVLEGDTPETLEARIHQTEYSLFPRAIVKRLREIEGAPRSLSEKTDAAEDSGSSDNRPGSVPPPIPPDQQWAQALGIPHKPEDFVPRPSEVPPVSGPADQDVRYVAPGPTSPQTAAVSVVNGEPMPPTYLLWAILSLIFCCMPAGIVAVIMASQVSSKYYQGDLEGAKRASRRAEIWIIVSFVLGVLFNTLYLPFMLLLGGA